MSPPNADAIALLRSLDNFKGRESEAKMITRRNEGPPAEAHEWLRRLEIGASPLLVVPENIKLALCAAGLAERTTEGAVVMTSAGTAYLNARALSYLAPPRAPD